MGDVVNLRRARKAKARGQAEAQAATNRAAFGRTRSERTVQAMDAERRERALTGARLDD